MQVGGAGDPESAAAQPPRHQKPRQLLEAAEDSEELDEKLVEMMEGPQRGEKEKDLEKEEAEPVDLLPIVDSVFGQVGMCEPSVCPCIRNVCVLLHQVLWLIECLTEGLIVTLSLQFKYKARPCSR